MDLLEVLRVAVNALPENEHRRSLSAVIRHVKIAIDHLNSGQTTGETYFFTDSVYRCNQAYEGSIKEAYKVLTGNKKNNKQTYQIEKYLDEGGVLKPRVLEQLRIYRQKWRNPSTHDHLEDFDENEAFLAIVNIAAFAKVCIEQVSQRLLFEEAQSKSKTGRPDILFDESEIVYVVADLIEDFFENEIQNVSWHKNVPLEPDVAAVLSGFLSTIPDTRVEMEKVLADGKLIADICVTAKNEQVIIEMKSTKSSKSAAAAVDNLTDYLEESAINNGILIHFDLEADNYLQTKWSRSDSDHRMVIIQPQREAEHLEGELEKVADS